MRNFKQVGIVFGMLIIISTESFSQGKFSFGGGGGVVTPLYSFSKVDETAAFSRAGSLGSASKQVYRLRF
jgi:hypothetical protein